MMLKPRSSGVGAASGELALAAEKDHLDRDRAFPIYSEPNPEKGPLAVGAGAGSTRHRHHFHQRRQPIDSGVCNGRGRNGHRTMLPTGR